MHKRTTPVRTMAGIIGLCVLFLSAAPWLSVPSVWAAPGSVDPVDLMGAVIRQGFSRHGFEMTLQVTRSNAQFLADYLPPFLDANNLERPNLDGIIRWTAPSKFDIWLSIHNTDQVSHFTSNDGFELSFAGDSTVKPGTHAPAATQPSPGASASGTSAPAAASASPAAASASPAAASASPASFMAANGLYRYHPLTLLWPFALKNTAAANVSYTLQGEESLNARKCWVIARTTSDLSMQLWISQDDLAVCQIEYIDPVVGKRVRFNAKDFYAIPPDPRDPLQKTLMVYSAATVMGDIETLLQIDATAPPEALAPMHVPTQTSSVVPHPRPKLGDYADEARSRNTSFLGPVTKGIIILLLIPLTWYAGRFLLAALGRAEFSKDLLLVEEPNGPVARSLQGMGYNVELVNVENLTEERNRLGKGPLMQPRVVVVAPHGIKLLKTYLYLLRAYIEDGGRALLLNHGKADAASLPFQAYFMPNTQDANSVMQARPRLWKRLRVEDVETKTAYIQPKEYYVEVNGRRLDVEILHALNRATGVRATVVGILKEGKGEYMLCQLMLVDDLKKSKLETSPITKLLMLDLIEYLQGRTKEKTAEALLR